MKKNSLKTVLIMTIIILPLFIGISGFAGKESENDIVYIEQAKEKVDTDTIKSYDDANETVDSNQELSFIVIDISGEVNSPGVYTLPHGSRILDAIEAAGGLTDNCDINYINRAELLYDEMKIYIPSYDDINNNTVPSGLFRDSTNKTSDNLININTANSEELQKIPGIGPSTAGKIIDYRNMNGKFSSIEELINISGIGNKTLERMKGYITAR